MTNDERKVIDDVQHELGRLHDVEPDPLRARLIRQQQDRLVNLLRIPTIEPERDGIVHRASCDEAHSHTPPRCCAPTCPCRVKDTKR